MQEKTVNSSKNLHFYPFSLHCEHILSFLRLKNKKKHPKKPLYLEY